jgi:hypothetical protein
MKRTIIAAMLLFAPAPAGANGMTDLMFADSAASDDVFVPDFVEAKKNTAHVMATLDKVEEIEESTKSEWNALVITMMKVSMAQSKDGKPNLRRKCFPKEGTCSDFLSAYVKGVPIIIEVNRDLTDKMLYRNICQINSNHDGMSCKNFDTGAIGRSVKINGEWVDSK